MLKLPVIQADAFTTTPFEGNPAAVVLDGDQLTVPQMQAIAREMNLSETAFVLKSAVAAFRLRFFTPAREILLAGHPTIAAVWVLVEMSRVAPSGPTTVVPVEFNTGVLPVAVEIGERAGAQGMRVVMTQNRPVFLKEYDPALVAEWLGVDRSAIDDRAPVQTVSTGTPQLMVLVKGLEVLAGLRPDFRRLAQLADTADFFSVHVFATEAYAPDAHAHARHFAPGAGVNEDPVTGSASGAMGAYLVHYGLVDTDRLEVEQGHMVGRPGRVRVEVTVGQNRSIEMVKVGGQAVTVMRGELYVA